MEGVTVVTGGAGFIGGHLVELLASRGERVRVVERPGARVDHLPKGVEIVRADIRDAEAVRLAMIGARHVYHLAANPHLWVRDRREFEAVNHQGTVHVLDAALEAGANRVLHASTESILTRARADGPIDENVEITEADAVGPYCLSKLRAEQAAMARAKAGRPVLVANLTMPVGPGDRGLTPPTRLVLDIARGSLPALLDCTLNLVDVRDAAGGLTRILEQGRPGRRYLLAGCNLTLIDLFKRVSRLTGGRVPWIRVPYPLAMAVAVASELWADHVSGERPRATITGVRLARRIMHFDPSRTQAELGLAYRPIDESLASAVDWLRDQGLLDGPSNPKKNHLQIDESRATL